MKVLIAVVLSFSLNAIANAGTIRAPSGYYLLTGVNQKNVNSSDLANPVLAGLSIRFSWAAAEPAAGVFNWSYVDTEIALAKQAGKPYMLRPLSGIDAPTWLYSEGVQSTTSNTGAMMPIPWDATMLSEWDKFIAALGARYSADSSLIMAHLGGPTANSADMQLPSSLLTQYPNAISLTYAAWQNVINAYKAAFPSNSISLNMANAFNAHDGLLQSVSSYAETDLGSRAALQNNSLQATTSLSFAPVTIISAFSTTGGEAGFQILYDPKMTSTQFATAIGIGKQAGAKYYEIYKYDVPYLGSAGAGAANLVVVPEPTTISLALSAMSVAGLWCWRRRTLTNRV